MNTETLNPEAPVTDLAPNTTPVDGAPTGVRTEAIVRFSADGVVFEGDAIPLPKELRAWATSLLDIAKTQKQAVSAQRDMMAAAKRAAKIKKLQNQKEALLLQLASLGVETELTNLAPTDGDGVEIVADSVPDDPEGSNDPDGDADAPAENGVTIEPVDETEE